MYKRKKLEVARRAYKLIKLGDPMLERACEPVTFPLSTEVEFAIDDCIDTIVSKHLLLYLCLKQSLFPNLLYNNFYLLRET